MFNCWLVYVGVPKVVKSNFLGWVEGVEARLEERVIRHAVDIVVETEKAASPGVLVHRTVDSSCAALCLSSTFLGRVEERATSGHNWIGLVL